MEQFDGFLMLLKTNFGKIIGIFIPSKFENTEDMDAYVNGYPFPSSK